jgi:hypothetical protein
MEREFETREARETEERRPLEEAGQGEAEGFEQSEELLRDRAEHREPGGNPRYDRPDPEAEEPDAEYGEPDEEHSAEVTGSDR